MGVGSNVMDGLIREAKYRAFGGTCYTLGRPTMGFSPSATNQRFRDLGLDPVGGYASEHDVDDVTSYTRELSFRPIRDTTFFRMLGFHDTKAIDISDFEGAEIILDLNKEIPDELAGTCDLLVDGSTLDNLFDPVNALHNTLKLLGPEGRVCLSIQGNYSTHFTGIPYLIITPIWIYDFFVANRFADCQVYCTIWTENGQSTYTLNHEHATRRWGRGLVKPVISEFHMQISVFARRDRNSTFDTMPNQHVYRSETEWQSYEATVASFMAINRAPHMHSTLPVARHVVPPCGWYLVLPDGAVENPENGKIVRCAEAG
jgi:hypothetical protein